MALDTVNQLVSLSDAKEFLKITAASEDAVITSMVNRASHWANSYTQRLLLSRENTDYYDGDGTGVLTLNQYPVTALSNLYDDPLRVFGAGTAISVSDDVVIEGAYGIIRLWNNTQAFLKGILNVKVVYTAGYALASVPEPIKEAVLLYIAHSYRRGHIDQRFGVVSETIGDRTTSYSSDDIPQKAKTLLNPFRSERVYVGAI